MPCEPVREREREREREPGQDTKMGLAPFLNGLTMAAAHIDVLMLRCPKLRRTVRI